MGGLPLNAERACVDEKGALHRREETSMMENTHSFGCMTRFAEANL